MLPKTSKMSRPATEAVIVEASYLAIRLSSGCDLPLHAVRMLDATCISAIVPASASLQKSSLLLVAGPIVHTSLVLRSQLLLGILLLPLLLLEESLLLLLLLLAGGLLLLLYVLSA